MTRESKVQMLVESMLYSNEEQILYPVTGKKQENTFLFTVHVSDENNQHQKLFDMEVADPLEFKTEFESMLEEATAIVTSMSTLDFEA